MEYVIQLKCSEGGWTTVGVGGRLGKDGRYGTRIGLTAPYRFSTEAMAQEFLEKFYPHRVKNGTARTKRNW